MQGQQEADIASSASSHVDAEANVDLETEDKTPIAPGPPYSIYTKREKWFICALTGFAGLFSPLSSQAYFPALPTLVKEFNRSTEDINLTVTIYIIFQSITPMIFGPLADQKGRRPMYCICLFILAATCVGLALVPANAYWLLMLLRGIQAAGSASTIAIGAGVIGDIADRHERGSFFGIYSLGPMAGPAIAPVIGGALAGSLGWRSIFWFICICASICFVTLVLFMPETLRSLVGNGSITPPKWNRAIIPVVGRIKPEDMSTDRPPKPRYRNPLPLLKEPAIFLSLLCMGITAGISFAIIASISTLFAKIYPFLNETEIGLCFMTIGGGMMLGSFLAGKVLDWDYQRIKKKFNDKNPNGDIDSTKFPIESARLNSMQLYFIILIACYIGFGWCLEKGVHISGPLILLFVIGYLTTGVFNGVQTLTVDLATNQSSSVSACSNLVRGALGAVSTSVIDIMIRKLGIGWSYTLLGLLGFLPIPISLLVIKMGPRWREAKRIKAEGKNQQG